VASTKGGYVLHILLLIYQNMGRALGRTAKICKLFFAVLEHLDEDKPTYGVDCADTIYVMRGPNRYHGYDA
jgi:hypothetical protein